MEHIIKGENSVRWMIFLQFVFFFSSLNLISLRIGICEFSHLSEPNLVVRDHVLPKALASFFDLSSCSVRLPAVVGANRLLSSI